MSRYKCRSANCTSNHWIYKVWKRRWVSCSRITRSRKTKTSDSNNRSSLL